MPLSSFQTCLLVSALASFTNAQLFLNLETNEFSLDRDDAQSAADLRESLKEEHHLTEPDHQLTDSHDDVLEHHREPILDHHYDAYDQEDEEEQRRTSGEYQKHFQEVYHPDEAADFGSHEDQHRHDWKRDDRYHPQDAREDYQRHYYDDQERFYGDYGYGGYGFGGLDHYGGQYGFDRYGRELGGMMPYYPNMQHHRSNSIKPLDSKSNSKDVVPAENNDAYENVLSDEDPAICFVKAYARKPLGMPTNKRGQKSNSMHDYWYDDEDEDEDFDNELYDDDFYSGSEEYYDDESQDDSSAEESSEYEPYEHFDLGDDVWDKDRHYASHHAQYFDLANQEAPPTPAPDAGSDSETDDEEDSQPSEESVSTDEDDDEEESSEDANAYDPHSRRRQTHGRGQRARRTRRQHGQQPRHAQQAPVHRGAPRHRRHPQAHEMMPVHQQRPHAMAPDAGHLASPDSTEPMHAAPAHRRQHRAAGHRPVQQHDRHAPPASARRHRRSQKGGKRSQRQGGQRQPGQQRRRRQRQPQADDQQQLSQQQPHRRQQRKRQQRRRQRPTNDEQLGHDEMLLDEQDLDDFTCPKFFERTDLGCVKPLSLWRGNGQKKKCSKCQKCEDKWFPQCPPSFVVTECDVCAPVCPDGMIDHDGTCIKPGAAELHECGDDEQLIDGECYRQCPGQTSEFDILCFGLCPMDMFKCGHTLCLKSDQQCPQYVADKAINLDKLVEKYKRKDTYGSRLIDLSHQSMFPFPECH